MNNSRIVITNGVRTPVGRYGGVLKDVKSSFLASHVIEGVLKNLVCRHY